jgi:hypothetical protein
MTIWIIASNPIKGKHKMVSIASIGSNQSRKPIKQEKNDEIICI